jgi:hypothetical protein
MDFNRAIRYLVRFPLHWVGLGDGSTTVSLLLFSKHQEQQKDKLSVVFKLSIKSRTSTCPDVLGAHLHVKWRVGLLRTLLYYMRPYSLLGLLIGIAAVMAMMGGSVGALLCLVLLRMPGSVSKGIGNSPASAGGSTGDLLSVQTTPRDIRLSSDEDSDSGHASPLRSGRDGDSNQMETSPRPLRPWEVLLRQLPEPTPRADNTLHLKQNASHKALFSGDNDSAMSTGAKFGYGKLIARDTGSSRAGT